MSISNFRVNQVIASEWLDAVDFAWDALTINNDIFRADTHHHTALANRLFRSVGRYDQFEALRDERGKHRLSEKNSTSAKFIGGLPTKRAMKSVRGRLYTSAGVSVGMQLAIVYDGNPVGHRHRFYLIVGDVDRGDA